ncbi:TPA: ComF family protein [Candidatus Scatousia excrementigallinarum]|uniref:ComF family protein n=1 Tax=Candidatus Scatousia excrementigallinarum TaxID=2840935 RepID=A0A9D1EWP7_9BACT|nr:ComF family protein [Candidatus Scatousia excrementigallinarum]
MKDFLIGLLDWIYKKKCYFCKSSKECIMMCSKCYDEMDYLPAKVNRIIEGKKVYCAGVYAKILQKLIRGLKYHNKKDLAYFLAEFMFGYWQNITDDANFQVVPVPIYYKRKKKRKYNHMEVVGIDFCKLGGYNYNPDLIERVKDTRPQYKLSKSQRAENLAGAFKVNPEKLMNGRILIIDDICTTGATFEEMIQEFKKNGITDIVCLAATTPFGD